MSRVLVVPGLNGSGPNHWQTWLEKQIPGAARIQQDDWSKPDLDAWACTIARLLESLPGKAIIVAHSFGSLATVAAARLAPGSISGAVLVAPADPRKFGLSDTRVQRGLDFPVTVVGSRNDRWMSIERARAWADKLGGDFVDHGNAGHINVDSGHGPWPEGLALVDGMRALVREPAGRRSRRLDVVSALT